MNAKQPLLSLCIPTYNRAKYLKQSLESLLLQYGDIVEGKLEIIVSENPSSENAQGVVNEYIDKGLPLRYNRNKENVGAARNFYKLITMACGKYIFLLGDDDVLLPGSLKYLLDVMEQDDWGLIHTWCGKRINEDIEISDNSSKFLEKIGYWITYMSASIFRRDIVAKVENPEQYFNTHFMQIPFYIYSSIEREKNVFINKQLIKGGLDAKSNGGYNLFEVFVKNYLTIWQGFVDRGEISKSLYKSIKKNMLTKFLVGYIYRVLIRHKNTKKIIESEYTRGGWGIEGAWGILFHYYGRCWYFYVVLLKMLYYAIKGCAKRIIKGIKK